MPFISIIDAAQPQRTIDFDAENNNDILLIMERVGCVEGHIYRDGQYLITAWKSDDGVWSLLCQENMINFRPLNLPAQAGHRE